MDRLLTAPAAVLLSDCGHCWAGTEKPCEGGSGMHAARYTRAWVHGLIGDAAFRAAVPEGTPPSALIPDPED